MTAFLKAADLTQEQFLKLVNNLQPSNDRQPSYIWLEAPDGWAFDWWDWKSDFKGTPHERAPAGVQVEADTTNSEDKDTSVNMLSWYGASQVVVKVPAYDCLMRSTAGRLFDPAGELRWRTIPALGDACWRVVFLGNTDWVGTSLDDHSDSLIGLQSRPDSFFLWGQQTPETPDEWIELRIPHRFCYPISGKPNRVKVLVEQWYDNTGLPHFLRLCNLEPC